MKQILLFGTGKSATVLIDYLLENAITENWKIWRVDFGRAFRLSRDLQSPKDLPMCGREFLAKLRALNRDEVLAKTRPHLTSGELTALMARRDKLVAHFQQLVAQQGEPKVLF